MPLLIPQGFASAALIFTAQGGTPDFITTIGVQYDAEGDVPGEVANRVFSAFTTAANGKVCGKTTLKKVLLSFEGVGGGASAESTLPPFNFPNDGSVGTLSLAIVMQKRTGLGGRKNRGRMFLPGGIQNGEVTPSGELIPALYQKAATFGNDFINALRAPAVNPNGVPGQAQALPVLLHSDSTPPSPIAQLVPSAHVGYIHGRT